jgi:signal transduction histidine kinase
MQQVTVSTLKAFDALKNIPDDELQWLIDNSECHELADGEHFTTPGEPLSGPHFIISGRLVLYLIQKGIQRELATIGAGDITGYLPYSRGLNATADAMALGVVHLLSFPTERIREMIKDHFEITQALVHVMSNRVREFTAFQQQNEKMMALGKLSAGLTHELNNPASAIVRDSVSLIAHLRNSKKSFKQVTSIRMDEGQIDWINEENFRLLAVKDRPRLTLKEKTKLEDDLTGWLEQNEIENPYDIAESFVDFNLTVANLEEFKKHVPAQYLSIVFLWLSNLMITERMVEDIQESSRRIADLVMSVKTFTHMDRGADKQYADIHIGIGNTLTMLGYKLRKGNITLVEDFDKNLPPVNALIGELNQVWTNLIDNALDAMEANGKGTLTIKTEKDREFVQVTIMDNGPGVPENIKSRVFDPFFTTKEMGKGTGMGLEVVQRIVVNQHNGTIKLRSIPGKTEFIVCFPIDG